MIFVVDVRAKNYERCMAAVGLTHFVGRRGLADRKQLFRKDASNPLDPLPVEFQIMLCR